MIKRILLGLGGTPYTQSEVCHAIDLARAHDAEITALTVTDLRRLSNVGPVPIGAGGAATELVQHRLAEAREGIAGAVELFTSRCGAAGIRHRVIDGAGDPFEELIALWRYHDLTILALRSLFEYGVLDEPLDMVVRIIGRGVRPILAVAPDYHPVHRVLVAYNGSMEAAKALKQFIQMRVWTSPSLAIRIVCFDMAHDRAAPLLLEASEYCRVHGVAVETATGDADAREGLISEAQTWKADAIVMGSTARARVFRYLLGDTAMHAIKHADVPLLMSQ